MKIFFALVLGLCCSYIQGDEISPEELERWFNSDSLEPPRYEQVNDGHLVFLTELPKKKLHHHHNSLEISSKSLDSGWIKLKQCHTNIDQVETAEIVFKPQRIRNIRITKVKNISKAWVEGASVQMKSIKQDAVLCLEALTHSLIQHADGSYSVRNGPFMRRFLDGYFPIRVTMDIDFSRAGLELITYTPPTQAGFNVVEQAGRLKFDTVFEGQLSTEFYFRRQSL